MSRWVAPESTRYPERPDPGVGWRQRLEREVLRWPARYRYLWIRRELARLERDAREPAPSAETLRTIIRLGGLTAKTLTLWHAWAREQGVDSDVRAGVLALIRGQAVQCGNDSLQAQMVSLASQAIALSGSAVHVLVRDDAQALQLAPGLQEHLENFDVNTAVILSDSPLPQRRKAYRATVTILSAREALRDYLNDRLQLRRGQGEVSRKLGRLADQDVLQNARMCGLPFCIVVDADQILTDQACEPLTIARYTDAGKEKAWAETALALAHGLEEDSHYSQEADQDIRLTEAGCLQLQEWALDLPGVWRNSHRRNADITLALQALRLERGRDYRIVEQRLELTSSTGIPDGMIQLLQVREGLPVTGRASARGQLTFQRFLRRYQSLAAVCKDTRYIRDELWRVYGLASFIVTPGNPPDDSLLTHADQRFVDAVSGISASLGRFSACKLASWRIRRRQKSAERLRRALLKLDDQVGNITAFSGRTE